MEWIPIVIVGLLVNVAAAFLVLALSERLARVPPLGLVAGAVIFLLLAIGAMYANKIVPEFAISRTTVVLYPEHSGLPIFQSFLIACAAVYALLIRYSLRSEDCLPSATLFQRTAPFLRAGVSTVVIIAIARLIVLHSSPLGDWKHLSIPQIALAGAAIVGSWIVTFTTVAPRAHRANDIFGIAACLATLTMAIAS